MIALAETTWLWIAVGVLSAWLLLVISDLEGLAKAKRDLEERVKRLERTR